MLHDVSIQTEEASHEKVALDDSEPTESLIGQLALGRRKPKKKKKKIGSSGRTRHGAFQVIFVSLVLALLRSPFCDSQTATQDSAGISSFAHS